MRQFRKQALQAYQDPDRRGALLRAHAPSGVRVFSVLAVAFLGSLTVSAVSRVPVGVTAHGMVRVQSGVVTLRAPTRERVVATAPVGSRVREGESLFELATVTVTAPLAGVLDDVRVLPGVRVEPGEALGTLVPEGRLIGYLALPARYRQQLRAGMEVEFHLDKVEPGLRAAGYARLMRIRSDLLTPQRAEELGLAPLSDGPHVLLELDLSELGAELAERCHHGMPFTGDVRLSERSILSLFFPSSG